jgi:cytochrome c biogenesis protein CcmG, thiol:disulfide interchange protein DsbE
VRFLSVLAACALLASCSSEPPPTVPPVTNVTTAPGLPTTGDALPPTDADGFDALLTDLRGTPVLVNFWASWCDPCKREAPILEAARDRYGDEVQFVGVDMQDSRDGALRFLDAHDVRYPSVFDPTNAIGVGFDLFAPPMTLVYDAQGTLSATLRGEVAASALDDALAQVTG